VYLLNKEINVNIIKDIHAYFSNSSVVIVDIDNTILRNGIYPIKKVIDYVNELSKENKIYIITGRPESNRKDTTEALKKAGVKYNKLMMNGLGNSPKEQNESKIKHAQSIKENILFAIDDKQSMRNEYKKSGIKTKTPQK
jgi:archaellum biogenesis ATPase FlaH